MLGLATPLPCSSDACHNTPRVMSDVAPPGYLGRGAGGGGTGCWPLNLQQLDSKFEHGFMVGSVSKDVVDLKVVFTLSQNAASAHSQQHSFQLASNRVRTKAMHGAPRSRQSSPIDAHSCFIFAISAVIVVGSIG